ncbi:MAG: hypothetical protein LBQ61_04665 [Spirochaetales bacterium]|jgi:hypothetical protein|nr:hypothetical protein [Spirochaetales bacterium]
MKNKQPPRRLFGLTILGGMILLGTCGQLPDYRSFADMDLKPPVLVLAGAPDALTVELTFDEAIDSEAELFPPPSLSLAGYRVEENRLIVELEHSQIPGTAYPLEGRVQDKRENSLSFLCYFYGYNPSPPVMIINEFTVEGSTTHPDVVELRVLSSGNAAGMALLEGVQNDYKDRFIFPSVELTEGEYVVIHFKPQGIPGEQNETGADLGASGGLDAGPGYRDFWVPGGDGLPNSHGVLSLCLYPGGPLIDGVVYSTGNSATAARYRGFGSAATLAQAEYLAAQGGWEVQGAEILPEADAINPEDSTATRSLNRDTAGTDTNSKDDWHIVPNSKYTFGRANSPEIFSP